MTIYLKKKDFRFFGNTRHKIADKIAKNRNSDFWRFLAILWQFFGNFLARIAKESEILFF